MRTNGWRRFRWDDLVAGRYPYLSYPAGTGHIIDGRVSLINKHDVPVRARFMLSALSPDLAIAVFTKTIEDYRDAATGPPGLLSFEFPGYYRAREFYSPIYDKPGPHHGQPDYHIIVEGMTQTSFPVVKTKELWVQPDVASEPK